jgi:hypothetical protein
MSHRPANQAQHPTASRRTPPAEVRNENYSARLTVLRRSLVLLSGSGRSPQHRSESRLSPLPTFEFARELLQPRARLLSQLRLSGSAHGRPRARVPERSQPRTFWSGHAPPLQQDRRLSRRALSVPAPEQPPATASRPSQAVLSEPVSSSAQPQGPQQFPRFSSAHGRVQQPPQAQQPLLRASRLRSAQPRRALRPSPHLWSSTRLSLCSRSRLAVCLTAASHGNGSSCNSPTFCSAQPSLQEQPLKRNSRKPTGSTPASKAC